MWPLEFGVIFIKFLIMWYAGIAQRLERVAFMGHKVGNSRPLSSA